MPEHFIGQHIDCKDAAKRLALKQRHGKCAKRPVARFMADMRIGPEALARESGKMTPCGIGAIGQRGLKVDQLRFAVWPAVTVQH